MKLQTFYRCTILLTAVVLLTGCAGRYFHRVGEQPPSSLPLPPAEWPVKEYWTGVVFNGDRIGFTHLKISTAENVARCYDIHSAAYLRTRFLMFDKKINLIAHDRVAEDLTLISFSYRFELDGNQLAFSGKQSAGKLEVTVKNRDQVRRQTIALEEKVYPTSVINLYPFMHGLEIGRCYNYRVYDAGELATVTQEVVAYEKSDLYAGPAFKIITRLQDKKMTTWMDSQGRPLLEMSMGGVIISAYETEAAAERYLTSAALNKDETLLGFSLIKTDTAVADPNRLASMSVAIAGVQATVALPSDRRQRCRRSGTELICRIDSTSDTPAGWRPPEDLDVPQRYLRPTVAITAGHPKIVKAAKEATERSGNEMEQVRSLINWIAANIEQQPVDVFTALDVLAGGRAECQGHALLYAAMARTLELPTRVVNGIVYSSALEGFVYHTWNESYLDGQWVALDPILGQLPADATHLKLVEGDTPADLLPLIDLIGKIDIRITDLNYRK